MKIDGFLLVFLQSEAKQEAKIQSILFFDNEILYKYDKTGKNKYNAIPIYLSEEMPILAKDNRYLKALADISSISQVTFQYTENSELVKQYIGTFAEEE